MAGTPSELKKVSTALATVLSEVDGLTDTREAFDSFYARLKKKGMRDPRDAIDNLCELIAQIKQQRYDYVSCIASDIKSHVKYSEALRETLEAMCYATQKESDGLPLNDSEMRFLSFLLLLHIHNTESGIYEKYSSTGF